MVVNVWGCLINCELFCFVAFDVGRFTFAVSPCSFRFEKCLWCECLTLFVAPSRCVLSIKFFHHCVEMQERERESFETYPVRVL